MKVKSAKNLLLTLLALMIAIPITVAGCQERTQQTQGPEPSPSNLSATLVPNVNLDLYICFREDNPTTVPAGTYGIPRDMRFESLAIWGVSAQEDFAFGAGIVLTSAADASELYNKINLGKEGWKKLSNNTIYMVAGSGTAAEPLIKAISNNDFKYFDSKELLEAASVLPNQGATKLAAIGVGKPSQAIINLAAKSTGVTVPQQVDLLLGIAQIDAVVIGLYSPKQLDIAKMVRVFRKESSISELNIGMLALVKSSLPGVIVEPAVSGFLKEPGFTQTKIGELTVYKGSWDARGYKISVLVRLSENRIFLATAGQEAYSETLITSVK